MAVTTTYYTDTWRGTYDGSDLATLIARATDVVDNAIYLSGENVDDMSAGSVRDRAYKAVCAQVDYIVSCGGADAMNDTGGGSVSLGSYSYSGGQTSGSGAACALCEQARGYLLPTGLLYKGADVF